MSYRGVRAMVIGASGFIGRWVARKLCEEGAEPCLVVRNRSHTENVFRRYGVQGELVSADLSDLGVLKEIFRRVRPAIAFNLAGYGVDPSERDEDVSYHLNVKLPEAICKAITAWKDPAWNGQNLVHAGSALEYGQAGGDLREDGPAQPTTVYGKHKLQGSQLVAEHCQTGGLRGVTARLFTVYGPGEHPLRLLPSLIQASRTGSPISLTAGTQRRDFTYVEDVATGLLKLGARSNNPAIINLATGRLASVRSFVEVAAAVLGIPQAQLRFGSIPIRGSEMDHELVSIQMLRDSLGWSPQTPIRDGVESTKRFESASFVGF